MRRTTRHDRAHSIHQNVLHYNRVSRPFSFWCSGVLLGKIGVTYILMQMYLAYMRCVHPWWKTNDLKSIYIYRMFVCNTELPKGFRWKCNSELNGNSKLAVEQYIWLLISSPVGFDTFIVVYGLCTVRGRVLHTCYGHMHGSAIWISHLFYTRWRWRPFTYG